MPLFRRADPSLRELIAYVVARAAARNITLNRTKLVKLLYLVDVERCRSRREPLTGLKWTFFHYGPYAFELLDDLERMEGAQLRTRPWQGSVLYSAAVDAPEGDDWPVPTKLTVDRVVDRFAPLDLKELLDYVYFHTGPMKDVRRGEPLDLARAREDRPTERARPLKAPPAPADLDDRLASWRSRRAATFKPAALDPPPAYLPDPDAASVEAGTRGRLTVPEGTDL